MTNTLEGGLDVKSDIPGFLVDMAQDFPEQSKVIQERVTDWQKQVDDEQGVPGLGAAILRNTEYVSSVEKEQFEQSVAEEMKNFLESHPDGKIFCIVFLSKKGSGPYFFGNVTKRLDDLLKQRVRMISWVEARNEYIPDAENNEYYIIDDSSNSGQQLQTMVFNSYIGPLSSAAENMQHSDGESAGEKVKLKIRLLRLTRESRKNIRNRYIDNSDLSPYCEIDFDGNPSANKEARTIESALQEINVTEDALARPDLIMESHAGRRPTVLNIYSSKAPDNLPLSMVYGGYSDLTKVSPLIDKQEYDVFGSAYPHYSNVLMGAKET